LIKVRPYLFVTISLAIRLMSMSEGGRTHQMEPCSMRLSEMAINF